MVPPPKKLGRVTLKARVKGAKWLKCNYLANACCPLRATTGGNPTLANIA